MSRSVSRGNLTTASDRGQSLEALSASVEFRPRPFIQPLVLSSGSIDCLDEAIVSVQTRVGNRIFEGRGSIYLSDLWAWPEPSTTRSVKCAELRRLTQYIAEKLPALCGGRPDHPLELGLRLHEAVCDQSIESGVAPTLAAAMCLSPFDAALHDAFGQAVNLPSMEVYRQLSSVMTPSADRFFQGGSAAAAIARMLLDKPRRELPAWLIVGKHDHLERDVRPWVVDTGYFCFKLKVTGADERADAERVAEVYAAVRDWTARPVRLSVDSNELNRDARSVLLFLDLLEELNPAAYSALEYLEQPTGRNIVEDAFDWRAIAQRKPVLLDEGLTSLDLLPLAKEQGWSGLALKTCKGHSFMLVAAAWAHEQGMLLTMQDLTNPGLSAIHSAIAAAHLPTTNGVELNSPQFTPAANAHFLPEWSELFNVRDGLHRLPNVARAGLATGGLRS